MNGFQTDLLATKDENEKLYKQYEQQSFLPVNPLQEKHAVETPTLTENEFEIMHMVLSGLEIHDIANKICLSTHGVKWRLTQVYWKFGVENRLQLIEKASTTGIQFFLKAFDKKTKEHFITKHTFHNKVNLQAHTKEQDV